MGLGAVEVYATDVTLLLLVDDLGELLRIGNLEVGFSSLNAAIVGFQLRVAGGLGHFERLLFIVDLGTVLEGLLEVEQVL